MTSRRYTKVLVYSSNVERCYRPISLQGDLIRLNVCCQHLSDVPTRQVLHIGWYVARRSVHELTVQHSSSTVISIHHYNRTICRGCRLLQSQFRLPTKVGEQPLPMILVAGGCGVAPIRAFLEELVWEAQHHDKTKSSKKYGPVHLFLGFRHPDDEVYRDLVNTAVKLGVVAEPAHITYTMGGGGGDSVCGQEQPCGLVSDAMLRQGRVLNQLLRHERAVLYVCGGARLFGAAIQNALLQILQQPPLPTIVDDSTTLEAVSLDETAATDYLRTMHREGRYHEDLSD